PRAQAVRVGDIGTARIARRLIAEVVLPAEGSLARAAHVLMLVVDAERMQELMPGSSRPAHRPRYVKTAEVQRGLVRCAPKCMLGQSDVGVDAVSSDQGEVTRDVEANPDLG